MSAIEELLKLAAVKYEPFGPAAPISVHLTEGNQLIGTYDALRDFSCRCKDYRGWQAHHVVESHDLARLHIAERLPPRSEQLCVLLPERAHIGRINSVLRRQASIGLTVVGRRELLDAYADAYALVGDYCGGGERLVHRELLGIVRATFRSFRLL